MTASRIEARFAELAGADRAAFIPYLMAGDPDAATTLALLRALPGAGADLIELGAPFSDPVADGPTIQRAGLRALNGGMRLAGVLDLARSFRMSDDATPLVVMGYLNPLLTYGLAGFAADAADAGIDGLIIVDCPPEEAAPLATALDRHGLALIRLATPTSDEARLRLLTAGARGFLYYVSVTGVTGGREVDAERIAPAVELARRIGGLPVAVGFGVRSPDQAAAVARVADAVVVGSALVDALAAAVTSGDDPVVRVLATARDLARGAHAARGGVSS